MVSRIVGAALLILAALPTDAQVPPPPSLPGQDALSAKLVRSIEKKDVPAYAALLAEDVAVFEDGEQIA